MAKINTGKVNSQSRIPSPEIAALPSTLLFSFKYLDLHSNEKFSVSRCGTGYTNKLLARLRDICQLPVADFFIGSQKALRAHRIDFAKTSEPNGFGLKNPQLTDAEPWQFEITSNQHGRIHGILLANTFYVIWIDPDHLLYP